MAVRPHVDRTSQSTSSHLGKGLCRAGPDTATDGLRPGNRPGDAADSRLRRGLRRPTVPFPGDPVSGTAHPGGRIEPRSLHHRRGTFPLDLPRLSRAGGPCRTEPGRGNRGHEPRSLALGLGIMHRIARSSPTRQLLDGGTSSTRSSGSHSRDGSLPIRGELDQALVACSEREPPLDGPELGVQVLALEASSKVRLATHPGQEGPDRVRHEPGSLGWGVTSSRARSAGRRRLHPVGRAVLPRG